jgi:PKD repeat protein
MKMKLFGSLILIFITFVSVAAPQLDLKSPDDNIISRTTDHNGKEIVGIIVPGKPPDDHREPVATPNRSTVTLSNVPAYDWSFGCSATSASMAAGYYDNCGYDNMYAGPTNGGVAPMNNSTWGTVVINGETRSLCPLSATMNGLDGRTSRGHVDDYWVQYNSTSPDPYITNSWTQHTYADCTGDFMGTNQSALANVDGSTTFYFHTNGNPLYNYTGMEPTRIDGCHGMRDFYESRGYAVVSNFSQYIYGYNGNTTGFTFNQYKQEIDSGRVVLIQVTSHTMLGYGYDDATDLIYLHDTWDYSSHTMTWGGSYSGLTHYGVTVVKLQPSFFVNANFTASTLQPEINTTVNFIDQSTANPVATSWIWSISPSSYTYVEGTSSTSRHPRVQFTVAGYYTVSLTASNANTSDTEVKTNYIQAVDCSDIQLPFTEDCSDGTLPPCWSIVDH